MANQAGRAASVELQRANVVLDLGLLHCAIADCNRPLKPPVFECEAGHRLCHDCRGDAGEGHCHRCGRDSTFVHCCPDVDDYVSRLIKVRCPFQSYGCASVVMYHDAASHSDTCVYAPCTCAVAGCAYTASPTMLRRHLAVEHSWPVHVLPGYGKPVELRVPASYWGVTVSCVRAGGTAEAGPQYKYVLFVQAPMAPGVLAAEKDNVMVDGNVPSCAVPGGAAGEGIVLLGPELIEHGLPKQIQLNVHINVVDPAPGSPPSTSSSSQAKWYGLQGTSRSTFLMLICRS